MWQGIVYLRSHRRRPVWIGERVGILDVQGMIPVNWCGSCGAEVFTEGEVLCSRCSGQKGELDDADETAKPLSALHPGVRPQSLR